MKGADTICRNDKCPMALLLFIHTRVGGECKGKALTDFMNENLDTIKTHSWMKSDGIRWLGLLPCVHGIHLPPPSTDTLCSSRSLCWLWMHSLVDMSVDDGAHALSELEIAEEQIHSGIEWLNNLWLQIDYVDDGNEAFGILYSLWSEWMDLHLPASIIIRQIKTRPECIHMIHAE